MPAPSASDRIDPLTATAHAALSARLDPASDRPIALALSGGGDSVALLALATDWAKSCGRRVLALTVDHKLNPDSTKWTARAGDLARRMGADWRGLTWTGDKPARGLPQAARLARHRLIAEAARMAGARVVLFGHTADDVAEADWMRTHGSTLGRLTDWSPSPVWPEGRGLMLARPLLRLRRSALRDGLVARGLDWIDDPANDDPASLRARARRALADGVWPDGMAAPHAPALPAADNPDAWCGALRLDRNVSVRDLAAALVCAGGGEAPPRGERLQALKARLGAGAVVTATLSGARVVSSGDTLLVTREAGERRRGGLSPMVADAGETVVWDGRFEITPQAAVSIAPVAGHMARLSPQDRVVLTRLPAAVRPGLPVLFRDGNPRPVLAWRGARVRCLVSSRFALATGRARTEAEIDDASVGEIAPNILSQPGDGACAPERVHSRT